MRRGIPDAVNCRRIAAAARVAIFDVDGDAARESAGQIGGIAQTFDVSDSVACKADVDDVAAKLGAPRVLVCCAAMFPARVPIAELEDAVWDRALSCELSGDVLLRHVPSQRPG